VFASLCVVSDLALELVISRFVRPFKRALWVSDQGVVRCGLEEQKT
jgi:hypothetical protein